MKLLKLTDRLDSLRVAAPCPISWESMHGDERVRFCDQCKLNVYNLSELTRREAAALIAGAEGGRVCGKLYKRSDGTVLTKDCPVGLRAIRRRVSRVAGATITAVLSFCLSAFGQQPESSKPKDGVEIKIEQKGGQAQDARAELSGVVKDNVGAVIPGAEVTLSPQGSPIKRHAVTNDEGSFEFPSVEPGVYTIRVDDMPGFVAAEVENIEVAAGTKVSVDLTLTVAVIEMMVGILTIPEIDYLYSSGPGIKTTFTEKQIKKLPF